MAHLLTVDSRQLHERGERGGSLVDVVEAAT